MSTKRLWLSLSALAAFVSDATSGPPAWASTTDIYLSQGGGGDGSSCASARDVSYFDAGASWGSNAGQIGPGITVHLCGTITTTLTFRGSGTSGHPVVLDGSGATLANAAVVAAGVSYWTMRGLSWGDTPTDNAIDVEGGAYGTIEGCYIGNLGTAAGGPNAVWLGDQNGVPDHITIQNNFFRTSSVTDDVLERDILKTEGATNVVVQGNYLEHRIDLDGGNCLTGGCHDDVIQIYKGGCSGCAQPQNWTIRYNKIVLNTRAENNRSFCMIEGVSGTLDVYGNLFLGVQGAGSGNGCSMSTYSGSTLVCNFRGNTVVGKNGPTNEINVAGCTSANVENNLVLSTAGYTMFEDLAGGAARDHNLWYGSSNGPSCTGHSGEICGQDPLFADYAHDDYSLVAGSPARGAGASLGPPYDQGIAYGATWPGPLLTARVTWDMGAFQYGTTTPPNPPTNLTATVR